MKIISTEWIVKPGTTHRYIYTDTKCTTHTHTHKCICTEIGNGSNRFELPITHDMKSKKTRSFRMDSSDWKSMKTIDTNCHSAEQNGSFEMQTCIAMIIFHDFSARQKRELCSNDEVIVTIYNLSSTWRIFRCCFFFAISIIRKNDKEYFERTLDDLSKNRRSSRGHFRATKTATSIYRHWILLAFYWVLEECWMDRICFLVANHE